MMKKCSKCKKEKELDNFSKNKRYKDGKHDTCKLCRKEYSILNKEKEKEYAENYRIENKEKILKLCNNYYHNNKDYYKEYNSKRDKDLIKQYNQNSKEYKYNWTKEQYKNNPQFKLAQLLRIRLLDALKGKTNKTISSLNLLGCSIEEYKHYLELQFTNEMSWDNHGKIWEIDHIRPCASYDLTDINQQKECFHYSNIQPLTVTENRKKKDKIVPINILR